ncbi:TetR/AcrR family transcriptional regulator [Bosea sp. NPDC003192]|uniref:TetR/AcrR family transcriptional regulator n=1 Tax=Bosea sp. NPDC003192 TaxID=3390551 RepID=UPI003CFDCBC9
MDAILAAARELFVDHGFDAVTMDMIARQAPVSKATLYAHFASKEELFSAVVVGEAKRLTEEVWRIAPESDDVVAVLRRVAEKFVDIFLSEQTMFLQRAVIGVVPRFPSIGVAIFESGPKVLTERLAKFLSTAHERGLLNISNPTLAATQFLSVVRGDLDIRGLVLRIGPPDRAEVEEQIGAGIDLFLHYYARGGR